MEPPQQKPPSPGSLAQGLSAARLPRCWLWGALPPPPTKTEKLGPLPVQPPRPACKLLRAGGFYEIRGEPPTQRRLCLCAPGRAAEHRNRAARGAPAAPQIPPRHSPELGTRAFTP